jgi:hypothetical protein
MTEPKKGAQITPATIFNEPEKREGLLRAGIRTSRSAQAIVPTVIRAPAGVLAELDALARSEGVSRNRLIAVFIDEGLRSRGRRGVLEIAPNFLAFLDRKKATQAEPAGKRTKPPDFDL